MINNILQLLDYSKNPFNIPNNTVCNINNSMPYGDIQNFYACISGNIVCIPAYVNSNPLFDIANTHGSLTNVSLTDGSLTNGDTINNQFFLKNDYVTSFDSSSNINLYSINQNANDDPNYYQLSLDSSANINTHFTTYNPLISKKYKDISSNSKIIYTLENNGYILYAIKSDEDDIFVGNISNDSNIGYIITPFTYLDHNPSTNDYGYTDSSNDNNFYGKKMSLYYRSDITPFSLKNGTMKKI